MPFSTGTDWCQYDFSRVYARMEEPLTVENWLRALRLGRTFITNGPLLDLKVNDHDIGDTLQLSAADGNIHVQATAKGRRDFDRLEVVHDGEIVFAEKSHAVDGHFEAVIDEMLAVKESGWLAVRTPPPSVPDDATRADKTPLNEYGREIFSHTSPIYIEIDEKKHFDAETAHRLLMEMELHRDFIRDQFEFTDIHERAHVLQVYDDGLKALQQQIAAAEADTSDNQ